MEFLSDEIYTSMKATLARHTLTLGSDTPSEDHQTTLSSMECRQLSINAEALSFFHLAAHLPHSCDPNVAMKTMILDISR